ncbi:energy-coupling factor ABC transporter substrate-binding protein [Sporanaerobium hydrogeniformans]|uniref:Energy-coupling factor ABC transporter substrate-binding protein n=1 Tax=Sporanaerobium hydrogeniformans TaxID=3072179 RepID=A0AC61DBU5_9FIRM|nr:energy-coupling factor ABC transporter substrate-binding protein [Sporanaerobium hydrogeniformans]PHV70400.1 energy-coupling factor ABC transporter substrate-binding protein [Sporanaerobium hydrogeniformans]
MLKEKKTFWINAGLILLVVLISILPLFIVKDAEFGGADGEAEVAITEINAEYEPWFEPFIEPASGEIESLLFALQAAGGAAVVAYGFGYLKGRSQKEKKVS